MTKASMEPTLSGRSIVAFLSLTILCGTSHEFAHHFTAAAICGCFGFKTFNSFHFCDGCTSLHPGHYWATLAGPIFTFALMWWGLYQLRNVDEGKQRMGFALIFANFPINRILFALMGWNDEQYAASIIFGDAPAVYWLTNLVVLTLAVPPLVVAYTSIRGRHRILRFLGWFILPFVFVLVFAGMFLEEFLLLQHGVLATPVIGIPWLVMLVEIVALVVYLTHRKYLRLRPGHFIVS
jgi:hypothetical protein